MTQVIQPKTTIGITTTTASQGRQGQTNIILPPSGGGKIQSTYLAISTATLPKYHEGYATSDFSSANIVDPLEYPTGTATGIAYSQDGTMLAIADASDVYIYSATTGALIHQVAVTSTINQLRFSSDSTTLSGAAATPPYLFLIDTALGTINSNPVGTPTSEIKATAWSPDGTLLTAVTTTSPYIHTFSLPSYTKITDPSTLPSNSAFDCVYSPDSTRIILACSGLNVINEYDVATWTRNTYSFIDLGLPSNPQCIDWAPNNNFVVLTGANTPYITILNPVDFTVIATPASAPAAAITSCAISIDSAYLAFGSSTAPYLFVVETSTWGAVPLTTPWPHAGSVRRMMFSYS